MRIVDKKFSRLSARQFHDIMKLRLDVFVVEQACVYDELDHRDVEPKTRHVWIQDRLGVRSYLRVLDDGDARRIGRVATRTDARSEGLASALIDHALSKTTGPWTLDAQTHLAGWYRERGFIETGDEFIEDGIPHVPMRRDA